MKKMIIMAIAVAVITLGPFLYGEMILGDYPAILLIKVFATLAFVPLMLGMLLGLLPRKALIWGILPWSMSLILVGFNWVFFGKSWITIPDNNAASVIVSFVLLGIFAHLGTEMTKAIKTGEDSPASPVQPSAH